MKLNYTVLNGIILCFIITFSTHLNAQVGINTTNPGAGSMLDIDSPDKGLLIPRINIPDLSSISPVTGGSTESLLVYNTNPTTVTGFYYWDGTKWVRLQTNNNYWKTDGNDNTINGTHFLGTTIDRNLDFKTNSLDRLRIPGNADQIQAMANGTNSLPFYSWASDSDVGMWRPTADQLAFSSGGREFIRLLEGANDALVINEGGVDIDTRIETNDNPNMLFVDGGTNRVGINTAAPETELHIAGSTSTVRIDELNDTNSIYNIGVDPSPVYVDANGDLNLQPPLIQTFMPINVVNFINPSISIQSATGEGVTIPIYNTSVTLTQESLVHISYQFSVRLTRSNGVGPIVDGASRLYRAWVSVDGSSNYIAMDTGTYTNNPEVDSPGGTYAAGYYYLNGNGYVQLPAGTHTLLLSALGFAGGNGGTFDYRMTFGETDYDNFQVVVHR